MVKKTRGRIVVTVGLGDFSPEEVAAVRRCRDAVSEGLAAYGYEVINLEISEKEFDKSPRKVISRIKEMKADCVFNLFEGFSGNSMTEVEFVRMLEENNIPFTGNGSNALERCLDKDRTKKILSEHGIKVPAGILVRDIVDVEVMDIEFPVFVKPAFEDASVGINDRSLSSDMNELYAAIKEKLRGFPEGLIVEEFISGKEYNAGFLGGRNLENLGMSILDYEEYPECVKYLNYSAKWEDGSDEYEKLMPRVLSKDDHRYRREVVEISRKAARALGCSKYFRVDLREKDGELYVLDVNPNPDISPDSGFIRQASFRDLSYEDVVARIARNALIDV